MGKLTFPEMSAGERPLKLASNIHVVLSEEELAASSLNSDHDSNISFAIDAMPASAPIPSRIIDNADMLLMEVSPADSASMQRIAQVRARRPHLPLIVACRDTNIGMVRALLRQGVDDVLSLPLDRKDLVGSLLELIERADQDQVQDVRLAPVIAVVQSIGGVGATTVATHLASALNMQQEGARSCIIDLDLQFGNTASYLGVSPKLTIADLLAAGNRVDREFLRSVAVPTDQNVAVIAAPEDIMPIEQVDIDQLNHIITVARQEYTHVILDLPANWTNWTLSMVAASTLILLVSELSVASLRQSRRRLNLFRTTGIDPDKTKIIINRVEKRLFGTINLNDAEKALGHDIFGSIHNDYPLIRTAHDQGVLIEAIRRKSKVSGDIAAIAASVAALVQEG